MPTIRNQFNQLYLHCCKSPLLGYAMPRSLARRSPPSYYAQLSQRRSFDAFSALLIPGLASYIMFSVWKPKRDALTAATCGSTVQSQRFGKVQYKVASQGSSSSSELQGARDVILFFHGTPGACDQYTSICKATSFDLPFPVVSISRPGCLGTEIVKRSTLSDVSDLHREILERHLIDPRGSPSRIHLLAIGRGGMYALHFAHSFPSLVSSLTLMSCATRLEGHRVQIGAHGQTKYLEGPMLVDALTMELKRKKEIFCDFAEMLNSKTMKWGTKTVYEGVFRSEFSEASKANLLPQLANHFASGDFFKKHPISISQYSDEYAFNLLRVFGLGNIYSKRQGKVNDLCNTCGVEIDFDGALQSDRAATLKALLNTRNAASQSAAQAQQNTSTKGSSNWKDLLNDIEVNEKRIRHQKNPEASSDTKLPSGEIGGSSSLVCVNNQDYLAEIKCPTLILHSPDDGKFQYQSHGVHASKHLPNAKLETFETFPHTLPLKDPNRVAATITKFIQSI